MHDHVWFHDLVENMLSVFASTHQRVLLTFIFRPVSSADGIYPDFSREDEEERKTLSNVSSHDIV